MSQLTDVAVRHAKPKAKSYKLSDSGLYLLVMPSGKKFFRWDFNLEVKRKPLALDQYDTDLGG